MPTSEIEMVLRALSPHNDGTYIEVAEDPDGLGLVEISAWESDPKQKVREVTMTKEQFQMVTVILGPQILRWIAQKEDDEARERVAKGKG